jgi:uncharacterized membrane protein
MDTNPYAPPKVKVADVEPDSHGLKRRSVLVMIVFMIISLGIYYLVWWFRRRPALNRLNSPTKLSIWPPLLMAVLFVIQIPIGIADGLAPDGQALDEQGVMVMAIFQLVVTILMIVQTFRIKEIIEDHATPDVHEGPIFAETVKLSGLMTFFFSIFYLQWAINRYVVET